MWSPQLDCELLETTSSILNIPGSPHEPHLTDSPRVAGSDSSECLSFPRDINKPEEKDQDVEGVDMGPVRVTWRLGLAGVLSSLEKEVLGGRQVTISWTG